MKTKKKTYIVPAVEIMKMNMQPIMAGSGPQVGGPMGGDALLPDITDDPGGGPGAGDFGDTPGLGTDKVNAKFFNLSLGED